MPIKYAIPRNRAQSPFRLTDGQNGWIDDMARTRTHGLGERSRLLLPRYSQWPSRTQVSWITNTNNAQLHLHEIDSQKPPFDQGGEIPFVIRPFALK